MRRREFLKAAATTGAMAAARNLAAGDAGQPVSRPAPSSNPAKLPRREYGRTGIPLSVIGLGGLVLKGLNQPAANRLVAEFFERGVNYFDVAPTYGDSEHLLGPALQPYRKHAFLACKTTQREKGPGQAEFEESLRRLRTDHFDLYQLHALTKLDKDVEVAFGKDGIMAFLIQARKEGRVRHLGFSAHSVEAAEAAISRYPFDSILFPINFATFHESDFGPQIVRLAKAKGMAILALKALARQSWPKNHPDRPKYRKCWYQPLSDPHEADLGLRFTLSQPVTAAVPPAEESLFRLALDLAMRFEPLDSAGEQELRTLAATLKPIFPAA